MEVSKAEMWLKLEDLGIIWKIDMVIMYETKLSREGIWAAAMS